MLNSHTPTPSLHNQRGTPTNLIWHSIFPFLSWLPKLNRQVILGDLMAGITGAIIVLPQGVAYAIIAGLPPEYGLYAAIVPAIIAALFGSSYHLISGPTVAMSIVVLTSINALAPPGAVNFTGSQEFINLTLTLTFLAGAFQLALGLARLGTLVNFVSHSVVVGFTAGAAILIATSQLTNVFGVEIAKGESFVSTWIDLFHALPATNFYVLSIALATLITAILFKKFLPRWPGMLFAMIIGSLIALVVGAQAHQIKLVPAIPASLPPLSMPEFSLPVIHQLATSALALALLGLVEAVSIARSVASRSQQLIDGNQEFIGQGLSNLIGPFFSCYAASGSFTRTGVNYEAGAKTPFAAIFAAISLALIILLVAPLTKFVPIPSMAGILLLVSYNLIDFHHIKMIIKASKSETWVLFVTFFATLFLELEFAIYVGVILSLVVYLNRTSKPKIVSMVPDPEDPKHRFINIHKKELPEYPEVKIIRLDGSLFFGAVNYVIKKLQEIETPYVLVVCDGINFIDVAGAEMLVNEVKRRRNLGGGLYLVGLKAAAADILQRGGYIKEIKEEAIFTSRTEAIKTIFRLQGKECKDLL
jgi:SulP family sulfate permease